MKRIYIKFIFCSVLFSALSLHSCTLEEYNPGAFTKEALATSIDGYETLINQCYFAMERFYYGSADWMSLTEATPIFGRIKPTNQQVTHSGSGFSQEHHPIRLTPIIGGTGRTTVWEPVTKLSH